MTGIKTISADRFDACLLDLDGVLTDTAVIHAAAWKRMFDAFLLARADSTAGSAQDESADPGAPDLRPFTQEDYDRYVDGRARPDGVRTFLASRGISVPEGDPDDPPDRETIYGLGNRKNLLFRATIREDGVRPLPGAVEFLTGVRAAGMRSAVVSSSRNCRDILHGAGLLGLFDAMVDGNVAADLKLPGKPAPDTYLHAAEILDVRPQRAVVFEDALPGVEAGRAGRFGLVVGVARRGDPEDLRAHGADLVIHDLAALVDETPARG